MWRLNEKVLSRKWKGFLDESVFSQRRFMHAYNDGRKKLIAFHPTYIVTGKIFKILQQNITASLVYGRWSSGKSLSFALYNDHICKYLINAQP